LNKKSREKLNDSENIWAYIEGSEKPNEVLVISGHYDHVGMKMAMYTMELMMMDQEQLPY
jgi:arginine utilization protein RocB